MTSPTTSPTATTRCRQCGDEACGWAEIAGRYHLADVAEIDGALRVTGIHQCLPATALRSAA